MAVGAVLGAGSERSAESVPDAGAERLPVAVPCGAKRRMAPQRRATRRPTAGRLAG